jgi:SAM-dependent methyltransferase
MNETSIQGTKLRDCPLCERNNATEGLQAYSREAWKVKSCRGCGFVYLENAPSYEDVAEVFEWGQSLAVETARRRQREPLLHRVHVPFRRWVKRMTKRDKLARLVHRYVPPGGVLDVGCGSGKRQRNLPDEYVPFGIEVSRPLAAEAGAVFAERGGAVFCGAALRCMAELETNRFSGVIMHSYLEHEMNPAPVLADTHRVLKPGGHLIIKVPNFGSLNRRLRGERWCGFRFPDHVNYFTPKSLARMVRQSGFLIARFWWHDRAPLSDNMWLVAHKHPVGNDEFRRGADEVRRPGHLEV